MLSLSTKVLLIALKALLKRHIGTWVLHIGIWTNGCIWVYGQTGAYGYMDKWVYGQMGIWTNGFMDKMVYGQMGIPIDKWVHIGIWVHSNAYR